jgi:hypothetical protein
MTRRQLKTRIEHNPTTVAFLCVYAVWIAYVLLFGWPG